MNKSIKKVISCLLAVSIICISFAGCGKTKTNNPIINKELGKKEYVQTHYSDIVTTAKKSETVYINTTAAGEIYNINVTDWIHTDVPLVRVEDISNLTDIKNVNTLTEPIFNNNLMYWDMDTTDLYYSGKTEQIPPISYNIKYFLDGNELSADEIAGKKGTVTIQINLKNSLTKKVKIGNKTETITCPFFVAGGTILSEEAFSNISIDHGTTISDGTKQIVFFTSVPGINESLGIDKLKLNVIDSSALTDTFNITVQTDNFELGNIMFAAIPLSSLDIIAESKLSTDLDGAKDVLKDIEKLQAAMNGLDIKKIINLLYGDVNKIQEIMNTVNEASKVYKENEKMLKVMGSYMTEENMEKLDKLIKDLENTDIEAIKNTINDPKIKLLLVLLPQLSENLSDLSVLSDDINDVMPIFNSLVEDMEDPEIKKSIEALPETVDKVNNMVKVLDENKELLKSLGSLASADNKKQIDAITQIADKYADIDSLSPEEATNLADRTKAWLNLGASYNIFTQKTNAMLSNVTFTYKTNAIKVD